MSSTAPLLQSWLAATDHPDGRDPYFLYHALDLEPVIGNVARAAGLACHGRTDTKMQRGALYKYPSQWVALSRSRSDLCRVARAKSWRPRATERGARAWSDDYANVVGAVK